MKRSLLPFFAVILLAGCRNGECPPGQIEIKAKPSIIDVQTKSPNENIPSGAKVLVSLISGGDYSNPYHDGTMSFNSAGGAPVGFDQGPAYYPVGASTIYLAAFNPAFNWTYGVNNAAIGYSGSQDILCAPEVASSSSQAMQGNYPTLVFKHILTQLQVYVQASSAAATRWGSITEITLADAMGVTPKVQLQVNIITGVCGPYLASGDKVLYFYQVDNGTTYTNNAFSGVSIAIPATSTLIGYVLCTPVIATDTDTEYTLLVKTTNVPAGVSIPVNLKLPAPAVGDYTGTTQGFSFKLNLNFVNQEIKAGATVQPWAEGGSGSNDVV